MNIKDWIQGTSQKELLEIHEEVHEEIDRRKQELEESRRKDNKFGKNRQLTGLDFLRNR